MARAVRVELPGAFYHVMARGDRRDAIVRDDADRATFVRTLAEASERSGFRVHAFAPMSNHYQLLLETPQANLSPGMGCLHAADQHAARGPTDYGTFWRSKRLRGLFDERGKYRRDTAISSCLIRPRSLV